MVVLGVWLAVAGAVAVLAGLTGPVIAAGSRAPVALRGRWYCPRRPIRLIRARAHRALPSSSLDDGRVIEREYGRAGRRSAALSPGERVLVWYGPADPGDVVVYGRDGRWSDRAFVAAGGVFVLAGIALTGVIR